ncbi:DISARM system phospholipase D-like protein DrmC [Streptomyces sp. NBC_01294]|uniref:DISARM system phospholipase D-like protein DrmC n=1 Tax=Streptomyces sp. NBC_01294 TaxID=2903815 RepID=UPI002DDC5D5B|nr:DISARM system phospholipase D-like protein DrmC [Streptomyces sp. NBC_01294]WRZ56543.1 DISARM system phospholipase D-like protein DrmC [Streptomyces sp. NBC_01294]
MSRAGFEEAAEAVTAILGTSRTKDLVGLFARGRGVEHALMTVQDPTASDAIRELYSAVERHGIPYAEAAAYLRGFVTGWTRQRDEVDVRTVWSGPATPGVPVRPTARVLVEVVGKAQRELLAMTYSARAYPPLSAALRAAVGRGVEVHIVVETKAGASGLLDGPEPAKAFQGVSGVRLWHWAAERRDHQRARQHAKLAVADRQVLWLGSANLTESGVRKNLEAGVLVTGGTAPQRAAEHIRELQRRGVLRPLSA